MTFHTSRCDSPGCILQHCVVWHNVCYCPAQHIESWLSSRHDYERERAVTATAHLLAYYLDNLTVKVHTYTHTHTRTALITMEVKFLLLIQTVCVCVCRTWCLFTILELCWVDCLHDVLILTLLYALLLLIVYTRCFTYSYDMKVQSPDLLLMPIWFTLI